MQNRKFRETRDIRLDAKSQNIKPKNIDEASLKRLVLKGLGMKKIPDMSKVNISQVEYSKKYKEYLSRLRDNHEKGASYFNNHIGAYSFRDINLLSIITNKFNDISHKRWRNKRALKHLKKISQTMNEEKLQYYQRDKTNILLHFSLKNVKDAKFHYDKIDEANVRLMLLYSSSLASDFRRLKGQNKRKTSHASQTDYFLNTIKNCNSGDVSYNQSKRTQSRQLNLKVYHLLSTNRRKLLASRKIKTENIGSEETRTQWIEFDVTKAVRSWINKSHENLEIEIQCDKCKSIGARILSDSSSSQSSYVKSAAPSVEHFDIMPVLNIIGHGAPNAHEDGDSDVHHIILTNNKSDDYVHHRSNQETTWRNKWSNNCYKLHQRCCRNQLNVAFKDIKGFEFILQPKVFDAGYCQGRCPPRHNPAHHHALLQSLIWQDDHNRAPRPCCAPSKLDMLEILHVDEEHTDKLKISTWSDMQVVECACS
ncbi:bone morphogenetic protein 7 isoform X2 [Drosophila eugracilis]|nr:bone morphogenetic protein 7 isoform X2 [Drosophila eugracilis]XP_017062806.1 bone morphogenetic protein 7 isoform X2 [Drosophila eugracilis]